MGRRYGDGKKYISHKTYEWPFMACKLRWGILPWVWNSLLIWYIPLYIKGWFLCSYWKVTKTMLPNIHSLFPGSLTIFSSILGFNKVSRYLKMCLLRNWNKSWSKSVIINHIPGLPQSFTQILKFAFHQIIEDEVQARLSFTEMDICHAREEQEFHSPETEFCF